MGRAGHPSRVMAGLEMPGAVIAPDRTAQVVQLIVGLTTLSLLIKAASAFAEAEGFIQAWRAWTARLRSKTL